MGRTNNRGISRAVELLLHGKCATLVSLSTTTKLQGAKLFSSIGLPSAYCQVRLKPEDVPQNSIHYAPRSIRVQGTVLWLDQHMCTTGTFQNDVLKDVTGGG